MTRARKESDDQPLERGDGTYVHTRAEDRSIWFKLAYIKDKYSVLWIPGLAVIVALGFDFTTPATTTRRLQARIDTVQAEVKEAKDQVTKMQNSLLAMGADMTTLVRLICVSNIVNRRDISLAGIGCPVLPVSINAR